MLRKNLQRISGGDSSVETLDKKLPGFHPQTLAAFSGGAKRGDGTADWPGGLPRMQIAEISRRFAAPLLTRRYMLIMLSTASNNMLPGAQS